MSKIDKVTGQYIDYKESNDNAPPSYSTPSRQFKQLLSFFANEECLRCRGTGYVGNFKSTEGGRCFKCIPDRIWGKLLEVICATGTDDNGNLVCLIGRSKEFTKPLFFVAEIGRLSPIVESETFDTFDKACEYARNKYGI